VPRLKRPDGVEIDWRDRGEGPPVVVTCACFAHPAIFEDLYAELARDHRVITYDPRGAGKSSRSGPYDMQTDADDLAAVLEDAASEPAVLMGTGDATHRIIHTAAARPDLVRAVVCPGVAPLGAQADYDDVGEGLASSAEVVGALTQLLERDYRTGMRTAVERANPQLDEDGLRQRVTATMQYVPQEATLGRLHAWIVDDARDAARSLGDSLWMLYYSGNAWFPAALERAVRREAPEAHIEEVGNGAISRPDLTAEFVRRITHC
jgi:pimeloyl-ACP methyl ester carboxylesterase